MRLLPLLLLGACVTDHTVTVVKITDLIGFWVIVVLVFAFSVSWGIESLKKYFKSHPQERPALYVVLGLIAAGLIAIFITQCT